MAQFETPVKVKRGDDVREAASDTQLNQLLWDGFLVQDGEKAEPVKGTRRTATRTPQQKAAATRKARKAAAEREPENSEASTVDSSAVSGDSAAGESTVGSNPS